MTVRSKDSPLQVLRRACWRTAFWAPVLNLAGQSFLGGIKALGSQVLTDIFQRFQGACRRLHDRSALSKVLTALHLRFCKPIIEKDSVRLSLTEVENGERAEVQQVL